jgi:hypothetical protein
MWTICEHPCIETRRMMEQQIHFSYMIVEGRSCNTERERDVYFSPTYTSLSLFSLRRIQCGFVYVCCMCVGQLMNWFVEFNHFFKNNKRLTICACVLLRCRFGSCFTLNGKLQTCQWAISRGASEHP